MERKFTFEAIRFKKTLKEKRGKEIERKEFKTAAEAFEQIYTWLKIFGGMHYYYTTNVKYTIID